MNQFCHSRMQWDRSDKAVLAMNDTRSRYAAMRRAAYDRYNLLNLFDLEKKKETDGITFYQGQRHTLTLQPE